MLSISLHASQAMFLASGHLIDHSNRFWCIASGVGVHLFYLSTFSWLSAIAFDTCVTLTRMTRLDARTARNRFILYNVFAWSVPLSIVLIAGSLHAILPEDNLWSPNYGRILCSISSRYALISFFLVPIGVLMSINVLLFLRTMYVVHSIDQETRSARCTAGHERSRTVLYIRLAFLMGLHWILLVICILFKQDFLWLLFDLTNALPGLFIAISFLRRQNSLAFSEAKMRSSQSQLSSLGTGPSNMITMNTYRSTYFNADASPNTRMARRLDDITVKLDNITRHLIEPTDQLSAIIFHRSVSSL